MTEVIKAGTILIENGSRTPESLQIQTEPYSSSWKSVSNLNLDELDTGIAKAGWTFFFMAGEVKITAFGFDKQAAVRRAVRRVITDVESHKCNCLEITQVSPQSFLGIPYVNVHAHARHIQKSSAFSPALDSTS
ncbi:MAG: hypothetical protein LAP39_22175 [Acidobacteriia bacterium]|nr:hypothetical protein [Terriglobia bacterium]